MLNENKNQVRIYPKGQKQIIHNGEIITAHLMDIVTDVLVTDDSEDYYADEHRLVYFYDGKFYYFYIADNDMEAVEFTQLSKEDIENYLKSSIEKSVYHILNPKLSFGGTLFEMISGGYIDKSDLVKNSQLLLALHQGI